MDNLSKDLSHEMDRELADIARTNNLTSAQLKINGGPLTAKQPRMAERLDQLIANHLTHIDILKRLKESL